LKVLGETPGQVWHMDSLYNAWAVTGCLLNGSPATVLGDYEYHPWPFNVGPNGMPREWDRLKELGWEWEAGDLIFFLSNRAHKGPAHTQPWTRLSYFGAMTAPVLPFDTFADSVVVTESLFFGVSLSLSTTHPPIHVHSLLYRHM
jgi:hypothetical protein